jgi:DNA repair protein RecO (recombination protein O)
MQWTDDGVILSTRRHGETSLIVELMTRDHGRHLGLVRGGRSRRLQPVLQPGNSISATWRARLHEHLGYYAVEPTRQRAAWLIDSAVALYGIQMLSALLRLLPERDSHPRLFEGLTAILDLLDNPPAAAALAVRFEAKLLEDLGFGLDLDSCAVTGTNDDLAYVSPKSGRAVTRSAAEDYRDRLLPLPAFLTEPPSVSAPPIDDIAAGFRLTGYFLARHVFEPRGIELPAARERFIALVRPEAQTAALR